MFDFLGKLQHSASPEMLKQLIDNGAVLIDVRTRAEFEEGHVQSSINIPLDEITIALDQFEKDKTYVLVCASGIRSRDAVHFLRQQGFPNTYNGGSWTSFL